MRDEAIRDHSVFYDAFVMRQFDAARSKQMGILKDKTLEVQGKEMEEANHKHTSVYVPQYFLKNSHSDSEEPEEDLKENPEEEPEEDPDEDPEEEPDEDPEEEPEEDHEEEPEEDLEMELQESPEEQTQEDLVEGSEVEHEDDQEEDSIEEQDEKSVAECATPFKSRNEIVSAEQLNEHEDEDPSAVCVFEPKPESETETAYQNSSDGKQRIVVNTEVKPPISQNYGLEKDCKYDEAVKQEFNIKYTAADQHSIPGGFEVVVGNAISGKQANSGKRRRSRWDQDPEDDKKTVIEDGKCKKRKTRWDAGDSKSRLQEPLKLTDLGKNLCGSLLDLEVQALRNRFSEISSILHSPVDNKLGIRVYEPEMMSCNKLMKEREIIFSKLAMMNAIFCKELYVPVKEYPTYNFIGLILGPKGNTQKRMEMESGAKIRLRGKGALKTAQGVDTSDNKDLCVHIEAISQKSLDAAVCMVEKLLIPVEEGMNDHKRAQLQELYNLKAASLINSCSVCKEPGHNHFACPQKKSTLKAACDTCGSFGHPTSGCPVTPLNLKNKSSKEISAANLYVGFLPQTMDDGRLRELFSPFGTITQSKVIIDQITGHCKGYGFVRFDTPSAASLAIMHMNGYQMDGHRLAVRIAGTPPATGSPATSLPVFPIPGPAAVATSLPGLPHYMMPEAQVSHYMMPEAQVSVLNGEGLGFPSSINMKYSNQFSQTGAPFIPQRVSGSTVSSTAFSSTSSVSRSIESRPAFLSTGLVSGSTETRTALPSAGLISGSTESRSAFPSTSPGFPGDPDYPGSVFQGDPDYPGSGFQSYFT